MSDEKGLAQGAPPYRAPWSETRALVTDPHALRVVAFCKRAAVAVQQLVVSGAMSETPIEDLRAFANDSYAVIVPTRAKMASLRWMAAATASMLVALAATFAARYGPPMGPIVASVAGLLAAISGAVGAYANACIEHIDAFAKPLDDVKKYCSTQPTTAALMRVSIQTARAELEVLNERARAAEEKSAVLEEQIRVSAEKRKRLDREIEREKAKAERVLPSKPDDEE